LLTTTFFFFCQYFLFSPRWKLLFFFPSPETSARPAKSSPSFPHEIQSRKSPKNPPSTALPKNHQQNTKKSPTITNKNQESPKSPNRRKLYSKKQNNKNPIAGNRPLAGFEPGHQTKTTKTQNQIQNPAGPPIPASPKHQGIREREKEISTRERVLVVDGDPRPASVSRPNLLHL